MESCQNACVKPLKLKGDRLKIKKRKKKHASFSEDQITKHEEHVGSGRIVSCGVTIHGFDTKFKEELEVGDRIIIFNSKSLVDESRIVVALLSQRSLTLDSPFSVDITSTTAFRFIKESRILNAKVTKALTSSGNETDGSAKEYQEEMMRQLEKKIKKTRTVLKYREKTGMWGYRTVVEQVPRNTTAEELLDIRAKRQGRDKYCH